MNMVGILIIGVLVVLVVVMLARFRELSQRGRFLRWTGFWLMALFAVIFGVFIAAETVNDPGGWKAVGLVALWLVPLVALCLVAWLRSNWAGWILVPLVGVAVGVSIWFALDPVAWRSFENQNGPVRVVMIFVLSGPLALWGLRRAMQAGAMLVIIGVLPMLIAGAVGRGGMSSLAVASFAPLVTGLLYLSAAYLDRQVPPPGEVASPANPKAA